MQLKFSVEEWISLDIATQNCHSLTLVFEGSLQNISDKLPAIAEKLKNYPLIKCHLVPEKLVEVPKYNKVLLGGTFDYLHAGHQLLLLTAITKAKNMLLVGLTGDAMLSKKSNKQLIQPFTIRAKQVLNYIKKINPDLEVEIVELSDPYGPAITRPEFEAIIVSSQTRIGADKINEIRKQRGMPLMQIQQCLLLSENHKIQQKISSTKCRQYILNKNKLTIQQFAGYKQHWFKICRQIISYLQIKQSSLIKEHINAQFNKIIYKYSEYWRYYHTNRHIKDILNQYDQEVPSKKLSLFQQIVLKISIWFHDIQYQPRRSDNEQVSAQLAVDFIKFFNTQHNKQIELKVNQIASAVRSSIISTKTHQAIETLDKLLIDLDMSVLDSRMQVYAEYAKNIKLQYWPVVKEQYYQKRASFLSKLDINKVFYFKIPKNIQANIKWQLQLLNSPQNDKNNIHQL